MVWLSASYDGQQISTSPSLKYILYRWRRDMGASYQEMRNTPLGVIFGDLEYLNIERSIEAAKRS